VAQSLVEPLTERELDVLRLIAQGLTNQEIADALFISVNTVKTHAKHIYEKLNVRNRAQATTRATELGLLR
jgi:LuxR family maltose regulon positive regulatory protein